MKINISALVGPIPHSSVIAVAIRRQLHFTQALSEVELDFAEVDIQGDAHEFYRAAHEACDGRPVSFKNIPTEHIDMVGGLLIAAAEQRAK